MSKTTEEIKNSIQQSRINEESKKLLICTLNGTAGVGLGVDHPLDDGNFMQTHQVLLNVLSDKDIFQVDEMYEELAVCLEEFFLKPMSNRTMDISSDESESAISSPEASRMTSESDLNQSNLSANEHTSVLVGMRSFASSVDPD